MPIVSRLQHPTLTAIREIADEFDVSVTATLLKLINTNQFPLIAVCHSKERRRWFRRARMIPEWWFPRRQLDRDSFAFDMLFKGASESSFPRKIDADSWFEFRGADRYEVREQSYLLPNEEILTVLTVPEDGLG